MLYAGLDLSRQRLDVHVLDEEGETVDVTAARPDADALRTLVSHVQRHGQEGTADSSDPIGGVATGRGRTLSRPLHEIAGIGVG